MEHEPVNLGYLSAPLMTTLLRGAPDGKRDLLRFRS